MARTWLYTAILDPEDAFRDIGIKLVGTGFGLVAIEGYKLKLLLEPEDDVPWEEIFDRIRVGLKAFLSTLAWVTGIGVGYKPFDCMEFADDKQAS